MIVLNSALDFLRIISFSILFVLSLFILTNLACRYRTLNNINLQIKIIVPSFLLSIWTIFPVIYPETSLLNSWYLNIIFWILFTSFMFYAFYLLNYEYIRINEEMKKQLITVEEEYEVAVENIEDVVISLARTIDAKDKYTEGHTERVSQYATFLAERLGLNDKQLERIRIGALIHDIGKIGINLNILNKKELLTEEERSQIHMHPELGEQICSPLKAIRDISDIVRHHHEKLDGSGYPDGLKDDEISIEVRIVTVADIFDALTTDRAYRKALDADYAIRIMKAEAREGKLDSKVVDEFEQMLIEMGVL